MKNNHNWGVWNIPAALCIIAAFYLLIHDKEGWGWFLFVGVLMFVGPHIDFDNEGEVEDEDIKY